MRILDEDHDNPLSSVCLYLTPDEAERLISRLRRLIDNPATHHTHLEDDTFEREITVTLYRDDNLESFDERSRKLIETGK